MLKNKVIIEVRGGLVQNVFSNIPLEYVVVDYDSDDSPYWRIATPAERESKEFHPVTALSKPNQLTDQEKIDVLLGALSSLAKDVQMALDEELDTSDEWFACQLIIIDNAIKQTGLELPE